MSEQQFIGLLNIDMEAIDAACREVFGAPVTLRSTSVYGELEANIGGVWYLCELADFAAVDPVAFVDAMKHVRDRGKVTI